MEWVGVVIEKVAQAFGQEQEIGGRGHNPPTKTQCAFLHIPTWASSEDLMTDRLTNWRNDRQTDKERVSQADKASYRVATLHTE